ncbi:hypothetical protein AGMMS49992_03320 [Clostridia bacterium]|nr:hypothetical protein AGMMS49992_03320 [Clostridia bacterium]
MNELTRKNWNDRSDTYFAESCIDADLASIELDPTKAFPRDVWNMLRASMPDVHGKRVLVPSSGDNIAVFGFHLLGATVTSTDIAERQLENAARIADAHNWSITFQQADSMTLDGIPYGEFDLVYMSNGVHVWISDLCAMYSMIHKTLKPGGAFVFFDTHPWHRPFDESGSEVKIQKPFVDVGPFFDSKDGNAPTFAWRVEDFLRSLLASGFTITDYHDMQSYPDEIMAFAWYYKTYAERERDNYAQYDWKLNPWRALPSWMGVSARK